MKIMVYEGPGKLKVEEVNDFSIKEDEVRMKSLYSGISHGTEMNVYKGTASFFRRKRDGRTKLFLDAKTEESLHEWRF